MRKRELDELAVIELNEPRQTITHSEIRKMLVEKTSDTIYLTLNNVLYGIVCLGDWLHRAENENIPIATKFTKLQGFQEDDARSIFVEKENIHKVPVVNSEGILLGDYSRWDNASKSYCNWILDKKVIWRKLKKYLKEEGYKKLYVVTPVSEKMKIKDRFVELLTQRKVKYTEISKDELKGLADCEEKTLVILTDTEEARGVWGIDGFDNREVNENVNWWPIGGLYGSVEGYDKRDRQIHYSASDEGDGAGNLLKELEKQGVRVIGICMDPYYRSDYVTRISMEISDNAKKYNDKIEQFKTSNTPDRKEYFGELLENHDYQTGFAQEDMILGHRHHTLDANYQSKYYNIINGKRKTCYVPEQFNNKVHMFGQCMIMGAYHEDKYTIMSQLQKQLNDAGYKYCVESHGAYEGVFEMMGRVIFNPGDIVIIYTGSSIYQGFEYIDMKKTFEEYNVPSTWFLDGMGHFNYKAVGILAEKCFNKIQDLGYDERPLDKKEILFSVENYNDILGSYIKATYLDRYFEECNMDVEKACLVVDLNNSPEIYKRILKQISTCEDQIVLFVPSNGQKNKYFYVEYIYEMVRLGTKYNNIYVVPGEGIVPYANFFWIYYELGDSKVRIDKEGKLDIKVFSQCIAQQLNIKRRYGLKHNEDNLKEYYYSQVLKEELPKYGVEYVEME